MTTPSNHAETKTEATLPSPAVELPRIQNEEDIPFDNSGCQHGNSSQDKLSKTDSLDDQITKFKYLTGREVLYISMGAMGLAVVVSIILSALNIENSLVENAFEVFKLIAMTVLGYLFGSNSKSNS